MPARIGDLLLGDGAIGADDVELALEEATRRRTRFASALVALGRITTDVAARALAAQRSMPAVLEKHLDGRDLALAELIPSSLAWSLCALPIALQRSGALIVCVRDPSADVQARLEAVTGRTVVLAITPEIALLTRIDETYPARASSEPGIPVEFDIDLDSGPIAVARTPTPNAIDFANLQLVDLDDQRVSKDLSLSSSHIRLPTPVPTLPRPGTPTGAPPTPARAIALDPTLVALAAADTSDQVIDALVGFLRHRFQVGVVLAVRGDLALGMAGFGGEAHEEAIAALVVPLAPPSALRQAQDRGRTFVGAPADASPAEERLHRLFGVPATRVCAVPIAQGDRVVHLLYAHGPRRASVEEAVGELETVAAAAAETLARISA